MEKTEFQSISPTETSKHTKVRNEITLFSTFLNIIKENFLKDDVSQHTKHDLQKILAWFIINYFTHNLDLISQARKNFRPQNSNDDTAITEQSDYVWDLEWSHPTFINMPQSISSQAISTISYHRDYVKVIPLTIDATPLNYNTFLPDTRNNSLNYCRRYGHSISECRQKQQDNQNKPQKHKEPNKSFYQYMKKDQNLPNKHKYSNNSSRKPLPNNTNYTRNQSPYNSSYRGRSTERRNTQNSSQNNYDRSNSRNNFSRSNSNATQFVSRSNSQSSPRNKHYSNNQSRNSSYNRNRNYSHNRNRSYSNNRNQNYPNNRSRKNSYNRSNYYRSNDNYQNRSRNNSQNRNSNYNNQYRNYSQSPHRNNNHYNNSKHRYRSSTPKHQRHINQVQSNEETTSDPPGIHDTGSNELQLNQINCGSSDTESDTENTISVNMITVENDYEPIIYEQTFTSHIYENQLELLHSYYIEPIDTTQTKQEVNEIDTVIKLDAKRQNEMFNYKSYLSKYTKRTTQRKNLDNTISLRKSKKQRISTTRS